MTSINFFKVIDYANRLDQEETTRNYINTLRSDYYARSSANVGGSSSSQYRSSFDNPFATWGASSSFGREQSSSAAYQNRLQNRIGDLNAFRLNSRDLYSYKHYRKSNATLESRNTRAQSPILARELDRYYKTERRSSYLGDISSGGQRDFRHYNYRNVPYFGGSDYYTYVPRVLRVWNNDIYPQNVPTTPVTTASIY